MSSDPEILTSDLLEKGLREAERNAKNLERFARGLEEGVTYISVPRAKSILGITDKKRDSTFRHYLGKEALPSVRVGNTLYVPLLAVEEMRKSVPSFSAPHSVPVFVFRPEDEA